MYDSATESLWSQILPTAIRGPKTGDQLDRVPSTLSSWGEWQRTHPNTEVLLPPPHSTLIGNRDKLYPYFRSKYNYEDESQLIGRDAEGEPEQRTMVIGVSDGSEARAYPFDIVSERDVVTDTVGDVPVVVAITPDGTLVASDRRIEGTERPAVSAGDQYLAIAGSRFERSTGVAIDGPYEGHQLKRANDQPPMFWRGWSNFNPDTTVYGY